MESFRFSVPPFTRELKVEERYRLEFLETEVQELKRIVEARSSGAMVAPAGSGKTVVLRGLRALLPEARHQVIYLPLADLSARDMCRQVAVALGMPPIGHYPALVSALNDHLKQGYQTKGMRQVVIIDDAHEMRHEVLRILKLLTNFEMDSRLVVSIILVGQLPLKAKLLHPDLEDIRQRLAHCGELRLLSREEAIGYIDHRVRIAGLTISPFSDAAKDALFEVTRGNMRAIDRLSVAALEVSAAGSRERVEASDVAVARSKRWM
jgi:general secretion pathway protein A